MFRSLYARMMVLVMAVLMIAMGLLSMLLYISIREDRIDARLNELATQATEVAYLASQRSIVNLTTDRYLIWKIQNIQASFDAGILVLDRLGRNIHTGFEDGALQGLSLEQANAYLKTVQETGEPIRVRTPAEGRGGDTTFTVVIPWKQFDVVMGAVIIHTNAQTIQASYKNILQQMAFAMGMAVALAGVLLLLATRSISRPVGQMANAAERIARGEFDEQIQVRQKDEIGRLAVAFNRMSSDLKNIEEMRRAFVSDVSHELRSPLTSMQGFLQGMLDGTIPCEDRDQYIRIVMDETRRMNKLVTSLLELSRIESGKVPLQLTRFDINELIRRVPPGAVHGSRGHGPHRAGRHQFGGQRNQIRAGRRAADPLDPYGQQPGAHHRRGQRPRHPAGRASLCVRALLYGRQGPNVRKGHGAGTFHRQKNHRFARAEHPDHLPGRQGGVLHLHPALRAVAAKNNFQFFRVFTGASHF
ncbi:MAG TPA: histidine kinase dimerization/phospho-acceptor domain-containing protein [Clostridia bacterium]|nr:histidine kinase dimerization/phospho-acceptor domain-containing protein [Clostridia bacterium]